MKHASKNEKAKRPLSAMLSTTTVPSCHIWEAILLPKLNRIRVRLKGRGTGLHCFVGLLGSGFASEGLVCKSQGTDLRKRSVEMALKVWGLVWEGQGSLVSEGQRCGLIVSQRLVPKRQGFQVRHCLTRFCFPPTVGAAAREPQQLVCAGAARVERHLALPGRAHFRSRRL